MEVDWNSAFWWLMGVAVTWIVFILQGRKKKAIRQRLRELDLHLEYVNRLKGSQEYLFGIAFFALFMVLFFISVGLMLPALGEYLLSILPFPLIAKLCNALSMMSFMLATIVAFTEALAFRDFSNIERTQQRIEKKRAKLQEDLNNA
ncbi:hypothetical protein DMO17_06495 [Aquipseudomonas alcaligenes]|uniref:Uncharacterized protein n=1 Tax=Aquipseudomonas alcaligenes TaxID=43263 RepID=A0A2V4KZW5_AQUAC|nr:hypothetical protein [Pseudomonas alcaligenes]PYC27385.1 hypothetical protein DMO17_06495 [Pseudomonas alcaligenes]